MKPLLCALLALSCTLPPAMAQEQNIELRIAWWGSSSRHIATLNAVKAFEDRYPHIKVKSEYTGFDGYLSRLTTQINSGTEPDVIQTNWDWLTLLSKQGTGFYDLNKLRGEVGLDQYSPQSLATTTVKGKVNALPVSPNVMLFYYNEATWKKAGVAYPKTWDELLNAGKIFKNTLGDNSYPLVMSGFDTLLLMRSWMYQKYQHPLIDEQKKKFAWSHQEWVEAFTFYRQLIDAHVMPDTKYLASFGRANNWEMKPWINGEWGGVYFWNATWPAHAATLPPTTRLVTGPYPMLPGAKDAGQFMKTSMMWSIGSHTRHPKEAALLLHFLNNDPQAVKRVGLERGAPFNKTAEKILRESGIMRDDDPVIAGILQSQQLPNRSPTSPYLENAQLGAVFTTALQNIDYKKQSIEEAVSELEREGNRILRRIIN